MPSRSFAIQRAVLNAAAELYPLSAQSGRLGLALRRYLEYTPENMAYSQLAFCVKAAWRDYVKEYGHPEADDTAYDGHSLRI